MRLQKVFLLLVLASLMRMSTSAQTIFTNAEEQGAQPVQMRSAPPFALEVKTSAEPVASAPEPSMAATTAAAATVAPEPSTAERVALPVAPAEAVSLPLPVPTPLSSIALYPTHMSAYLDAFHILKDDNSCSRFFGGPAAAIEVLNRLTQQLKSSPLEKNTIAIRMSGDYTLIQNHKTGVVYRLFDHVTINSRGPLSSVPVKVSLNTSVGKFPISTRGAKALILLHELGHLVRDSKGEWLLPNDGQNTKLSLRNTEVVEDHCLKQLRELAE